MSAILTAALEYAERFGWEVFPAPPCEKKSYKSAAHSDGKNWGMTNDPNQIQHDWSRWPSANVGIPTGAVNQFWVMEADTEVGHGVDGLASLRQLEEKHGPLPLTKMAMSPSGSTHYYWSWSEDAVVRNSTSKIGPGIDVRGEGGMVIAPPSARADGQYRWLNDAPIARAPEWLIEMVTATHDVGEIHHGDCPTNETSIEEVEAALSVVDPDIDRTSWIGIGCCLYKAFGHEIGFDLWDRWSKRGSTYPGYREIVQQWNSLATRDGYGWNIATLFYHANEADPTWRDAYDARIEAQYHKAISEAPTAAEWAERVKTLNVVPTVSLTNVRAAGIIPDQQAEMRAEPARAKPNQTYGEVTYSRVADIEAKRVEWLWPNRIALGKLTTIAGMPDVNKSTFTLHLAAQVTTGGPWPCNEGTAPLGSVVILSAEDDIADTVRPRLEVAGADINRVYVIRAVNIPNGGTRGFDLTADVLRLERVIKQIGDVKMVIIDPISAYMGKPGKMDSHRSTDVRATLAPLQELAARCKVAVVAIDHLNKSGGTTALLRVLNSIAFVAAARAVYIIVRDGDDANRRLLLAAKNNLGRIRTGLAFKVIEKLTPAPLFDAQPSVEWENGPVDMTADEALAAKHDGRASEKLERAKALLRDLLAGGPVKQKEIEAKAREQQIGSKSLRNAREALGIASSRADGVWWWRMPSQVEPM